MKTAPDTTALFSPEGMDKARRLLCHLGDSVLAAIAQARAEGRASDFAAVAGETAADTLYAIDRITEEKILDWFARHWPARWPVELVMEGIDEEEPIFFPHGISPAKAVATCILDPIDGTRGLMYDKRSAWSLAALAPRHSSRPRLADITIAAMTELPVTKQTLRDQISGIRGCGMRGLAAERRDFRDGRTQPIRVRP